MTTAARKPSTRKPRALAVVEQEAVSPEMVTFEYDGVQYEFDPEDVNDVEILEQFEEGKIVIPTKAILGDVQWAEFKKKKRGGPELTELVEAMFAAMGATPGE